MASSFKTATAANVGTSLTTVYTAPAGSTCTIIGLYICNQSGGSIEANTVFSDSSSSTLVNITHNTPIPSGTSIAVIGGDAKVVLEEGDGIRIQSNIASSLDVVLSYLEQT